MGLVECFESNRQVLVCSAELMRPAPSALCGTTVNPFCNCWESIKHGAMPNGFFDRFKPVIVGQQSIHNDSNFALWNHVDGLLAQWKWIYPLTGAGCLRRFMDEIWGFVGKKDRNVREGEDAVGSVWTFCAIDAETKLVPAFKVGNRDAETAKAFVQDVADRMAYRVQISTDGLTAYVPAMESAFGGDVDYAQIIKTYGHEEVSNNRRYSAPEFVSSEKKVVVGQPDERLISTSYIERLNATTRLHMRRLTRLTLAFSKKRENFEAAVALHFAYYNFVKRHSTIRCTPAMAAGVTGTFWNVGDLVEAAA
jgi:IS1 family transposase